MEVRKFFWACVRVAVVLPIATALAIIGNAQTAAAKVDEGCDCEIPPSAKCAKAIEHCYILVCSDGTSKNCNGDWIQQ